ncbi:MAG TPA: ATP-binding protein [Capillimicrobium sp.]|nr:ATP-binding protein [Capillimicrobium sp.]
MNRLRLSIRARLTALYAGLFGAAGAALLGVTYWLVSRHLDRTLPGDAAADALADLRGQFALALAGTLLLAIVLGWAVAGRALRPLAEITATARRVSQDRLDERIALGGPHDELRELADTFDDMLERLAAAFASQRRFVANASHELRTPMTVLRAEVDVALADPDASVAELRAMGETVREATIETEQLLESLLTLARSEAGVDQRVAVDLGAAVARAVDLRRDEAAERGIALRVEAPAEAPTLVDGDRRLLERLAANLVDNAVRHNVAGGWVRVALTCDPDAVRLAVENAGDPIPDASAARLVEPFQRLARRGDGPSGAGLGLSIVRAVAIAHGGDVDVRARPGGGLTVTVRLPRSAASTPAPSAAATSPARTRAASPARS